MKRLVPTALLAITLLNFLVYPGHTWLQSDTQIYVPILERLWDPSVLGKDLVAQHPHVAFTLYDETAIALRKTTGLDFERALEGLQFLLRVLGIWGVFLIAESLGLPELAALFVAAVFSLGATIMGPAVLVFEYEPVPRGFAVPLLFLAIGLAAKQRYLAAGVAASAAFLFHAPTVAPFWAVYVCMALAPREPAERRKRLAALLALAAAALILFGFWRYQIGGGEAQTFFSRIGPEQEQLQKLRGSYNWISIWWTRWLPSYLILFAASLGAYWRVRQSAPQPLRFFLIGMPLTGLLSLPLSYLLLEKLHWSLIPQVQPTRALLFITAFAMILAAAAACKAVELRRYAEAFAWLLVAYLPPVNREVAWPSWNRVGVLLVLALLGCAAIWAAQKRRPWVAIPIIAALIAPAILIPTWGRMQNYPPLHTPELRQLSQWAAASTPKDAVFLFPDADQDLYPGVFRAQAERAVYVDWKSGGQVNFFKDLGEEWWARWQKTMAAPFDPQNLARYHGLGIDYLVVLTRNRVPNAPAVFENSSFAVYKL